MGLAKKLLSALVTPKFLYFLFQTPFVEHLAVFHSFLNFVGVPFMMRFSGNWLILQTSVKIHLFFCFIPSSSYLDCL